MTPALQQAFAKARGGDAADLTRLAQAGDIDAQFYLADLMIVGHSPPSRANGIHGLDEARGWYEKVVGPVSPELRSEAAERAKLMIQLKDVMVREGKGQ